MSMTEIERKALEILNDVHGDNFKSIGEHGWYTTQAALLRAIEQHEAFRQQVSDAVVEAVAWLIKDGNPDCGVKANAILSRFIITKPDPLVEVLSEAGYTYLEADSLRAALAKRGLEIREKSDG